MADQTDHGYCGIGTERSVLAWQRYGSFVHDGDQ